MPENRVKGPAIGLLVVSILAALYCVVNAVGSVIGTTPMEWQGQKFEASPVVGVLVSVFFLGASGFIGFGAMQMMKLQSHGLCMAAAIVSLIPCIHNCCILGIPFGIWALIVLNDAEVKAAFQGGGANRMPPPPQA